MGAPPSKSMVSLRTPTLFNRLYSPTGKFPKRDERCCAREQEVIRRMEGVEGVVTEVARACCYSLFLNTRSVLCSAK